MKQNLAIVLVCLVYMCSCTGLSLGDGSDMRNNSDTWQDATLLNRDSGADNAVVDANSAPPGSSSSSNGLNLQINGTNLMI